jgi:hypothetical protein
MREQQSKSHPTDAQIIEGRRVRGFSRLVTAFSLVLWRAASHHATTTRHRTITWNMAVDFGNGSGLG